MSNNKSSNNSLTNESIEVAKILEQIVLVSNKVNESINIKITGYIKVTPYGNKESMQLNIAHNRKLVETHNNLVENNKIKCRELINEVIKIIEDFSKDELSKITREQKFELNEKHSELLDMLELLN